MKKLIENGMSAARVNFSHGTYESHGEMIAKLKQAREEMNAPIPLILDTKGPEIRVKTFKKEKLLFNTINNIITSTIFNINVYNSRFITNSITLDIDTIILRNTKKRR